MRIHSSSRIGFLTTLVGAGSIVCSGVARGQVELREIEGDKATNYFGTIMAILGDVDGDGVADVLTSTPWYPDLANSQGRAWVLSGATGVLLRTHDPLPRQSGAFGIACASIADLNGDGITDYVIGALNASSKLGGVTAYDGATGAVLWDVLGNKAVEGFGGAVADAGDLDGDGLSEVLIGRPFASHVDVYTSAGAPLYSVHGTPTGNFGLAMVGLQDLDGDGVADFAVGEPDFTDNSTTPIHERCGRVRIYSGATGKVLSHSEGNASFVAYGWPMSRAPDCDGDGFDDLLIGAPYSDEGGYSRGIARVQSSKTNTEIRTHTGVNDHDDMGYALAGIGDLDLDGVPDYAVSAASAAGGLGVVNLFSATTGALLFEQVGEEPSFFGYSLVGADFNQDGIGDWVVGEPYYDNSSTSWWGSIYFYLGAPPQAASYGAGWPGTNGVPALDCTQMPTIDDTCEVQIGNSKSGLTLGLLFLGTSDANLVTSAGGTLLVTPLYSLLFLVNGATTKMAGTIPDDESLAFANLYLQAIEADPGASDGFAFTPGLKLMIGMLDL